MVSNNYWYLHQYHITVCDIFTHYLSGNIIQYKNRDVVFVYF